MAESGSPLRDSLNTDVQGFQLLSYDALSHTPTQVLHHKLRTAILWEREGVETHTAFPIRDRSALTAALNPSVVEVTTINFSPFSWAIRPPGQVARNQTRE